MFHPIFGFNLIKINFIKSIERGEFIFFHPAKTNLHKIEIKFASIPLKHEKEQKIST